MSSYVIVLCEQSLGANLTIIYNYAGQGLLSMVAQSDVPHPVTAITWEDAQTLINYINLNPQPVMIDIAGTGALNATEKTALNTIINALPFGSDGQQLAVSIIDCYFGASNFDVIFCGV
jgi:hypothetical protein